MSEEAIKETPAEETEPALSDEITAELERLRQEATDAFTRGYEDGRKAQATEDDYYIQRASDLARLLAQAEEEIQRLRRPKQ